MQRECESPEGCIYAVGVVGEGNRIHQNGALEVTPSQLIYTPDGEQDSYIWPLRYLKKYCCESDSKFVIETGSQCPSGAGVYTFSTKHAAELLRIVSRNITNIITSPKHIRAPTRSQTTPTPSPTFPPSSPSMSYSPNFHRLNGVSSPHSPSPHPPHPHRCSRSSLSPTTSPVLSRSPSVRSLPENAFEVKNIGEDESMSQDGILEVTSQELIYTENTSQHKRVWPLMFLRQYGCSGNIFSIEAGRRCPGGPGYYAFATPRVTELHELVQSYARNLCSSLASLCSVEYSTNNSLAISSSSPLQSYSHTPNSSTSTVERSESPVFHRSDSFIRRAFSAMELSKNMFEVHNLGDNQEVLGKGTLEVTTSELIYVDAATGVRWKWPIKYLRRYGCNGVRVFSFEAGRRCPGGPGLYAFGTSRASDIQEAIVDSINANSGNAMQVGNLSMSRLSLADAGSTAQRNGLHRKTSVPVGTMTNHTHFLTPPPMRRPSQPTLEEIPSSYPHTSTPDRQTSLSSDEADAIDGASQSSGTVSPPPNPPVRHTENSPPLPPPPPPPDTTTSRHHMYDLPHEAIDQFLQRQDTNSRGDDSQVKSSPKRRKSKPRVPLPNKAGSGKEKSQRLSTSNEAEKSASPSSTYKWINGHINRVSDSYSSRYISEPASSASTPHQEECIYQNLEIKSLSKTPERTQLTSSFQDGDSGSVVPQPSEGSSSIYENLSSYQRSEAPPSQPTDSQSSETLYANLSEISTDLESGRGNSTPSSPSTLTSTSYTEVEIIDVSQSQPVTSPNSTAWSSSSTGEKRRDNSLNRSSTTSSGCGMLASQADKSKSVIYEDLNFSMMTSLATLKEHRGDKQNFADLLERHKDRDSTGSRKRKS